MNVTGELAQFSASTETMAIPPEVTVRMLAVLSDLVGSVIRAMRGLEFPSNAQDFAELTQSNDESPSP